MDLDSDGRREGKSVSKNQSLRAGQHRRDNRAWSGQWGTGEKHAAESGHLCISRRSHPLETREAAAGSGS